jgi:hypothetical protein
LNADISATVPLTMDVRGKREVVGVADVLPDGSVHASIFTELRKDLADRIKGGQGAEFSLAVHVPPGMPKFIASANTKPVTNAMELTEWIAGAVSSPPEEQ